jgi:hypothetical protein
MPELTGQQLWQAQQTLEESAANLLGKMLFEFARLDMALGLCIVWVEGGRRLEALTKQAAQFSFHRRLDFLAQCVDSSLPKGSKRHTAYSEWLKMAHISRLQRNELVHGRWGVDAAQNQVVNVVGLPTSPDQREVRYSLEELNAVLVELHRLQVRLSRLRERWPL